MSRTSALASLAALLLLTPLTAEATLSRAVKFEEKVEQAASIVLGRCVAQESRWDDAKQWILTYSTFEVEKTFKGAPAQRITIVTPGGRIGNISQDVVGAPRFSAGDQNVLFVRNSRSGPTVLYFEQGAYRVTGEARSDRMVRPMVSSEVLVDSQRGVALAPEHPRSLREFEGAVTESIRRREALRMEMLEKQKKEEESLWTQLQRNRLLVLLAIAGALFATWQFMKRS